MSAPSPRRGMGDREEVKEVEPGDWMVMFERGKPEGEKRVGELVVMF